MKTRLRALLVCLASCAGPMMLAETACAGDAAEMRVIGFSADARIFAFEEYGVQDGSGFPYSNIYLIDVERNKFTPGSPVRVTIEREAPVKEARALAWSKAQALVTRYGADSDPGAFAVYRAAADLGAEGDTVRFNRYPRAPKLSRPYAIQLQTKPFPATKDCLNAGNGFNGFLLKLIEADAKPVDRLLYEDASVPPSRKCPTGYRIGAVVMDNDKAATAVAMIQVSSQGFEGDDIRWVAIPIKLDAP
jgi:predicted secreted protein